MSLFLQCLIYALSSSSTCDSWNIPEKQRFLQLTAEQQQPVFELMRILGAVSALCVTLSLMTLQIGMYLTARGITNGLSWPILVAMFAPIACLLAALLPWSNAVKKTILEASPH